MRNKYAVFTGQKKKGDGGHGRYVDPSRWKSGPDPLSREKYYAWLKHRSQAKYRGEDHSISWEQWQEYWPDQQWFLRGKTAKSLVLGRIDWSQGWSSNNCRIMTRKEHFDIRRKHDQSRL